MPPKRKGQTKNILFTLFEFSALTTDVNREYMKIMQMKIFSLSSISANTHLHKCYARHIYI
jgi:hypothetical protein